MAEEVKGLNIKLGLDTSGLSSGLDSAETSLKKAQTTFKGIQREMQRSVSPLQKWKTNLKSIRSYMDATSAAIKKAKDKMAELAKAGKNTDAQKKEVKELSDQFRVLAQEAEFAQGKIGQIRANNLKKAADTISSISLKVTAAITAIGAAGIKAANTISDSFDEAAESGLDFETFQRIADAASKLGVSSSSAKTAMSKVNGILGDLATGNGLEAAQTLSKIGLDYKEIAGMDTEKAFKAILDGLNGVANANERVALANDLFGDKLGTKLLPLINAGTEQLETLMADAQIFSDEEAKGAKEIQKTWEDLKMELAKMAAKTFPVLLKSLKSLMSFIEKKVTPLVDKLSSFWNGMSEGSQKAVSAIGLVMSALSPFLGVLSKVISLVAGKGGIGALLSKAGPIAAIVTVLVTAYAKSEAFRKSISDLFESVMGMIEKIMPPIEALWDAIKPVFDLAIDTIIKVVVDNMDTLTGILSTVAGIIADVLEILKPVLDVAMQLVGVVMEFMDAIGSDVISDTLTMISDAARIIGGIVKVIKDLFGLIGAFLSGDAEGMSQWCAKLGEDFTGTFGSIGKMFESWWDGLKNVFGNITNWFKDVFGKIKDWFQGIFKNISDGFQNAFGNVGNFVANIGTGASNAWNGFTDWLSSWTGGWKQSGNSNVTNNVTNNTNNNVSVYGKGGLNAYEINNLLGGIL